MQFFSHIKERCFFFVFHALPLEQQNVSDLLHNVVEMP